MIILYYKDNIYNTNIISSSLQQQKNELIEYLDYQSRDDIFEIKLIAQPNTLFTYYINGSPSLLVNNDMITDITIYLKQKNIIVSQRMEYTDTRQIIFTCTQTDNINMKQNNTIIITMIICIIFYFYYLFCVYSCQ